MPKHRFHFAAARPILASTLLLPLSFLPVLAQSTNTKRPGTRDAAQTAAAEPKPAASTASGMVVAVDKDTHQLRQPTAEEMKALNANKAAQPASRAKSTMRAANGAYGVRLDRSADSYYVVTKTPNGKLKSDCVTGSQAAEKQVKGPVLSKEKLDVQ